MSHSFACFVKKLCFAFLTLQFNVWGLIFSSDLSFSPFTPPSYTGLLNLFQGCRLIKFGNLVSDLWRVILVPSPVEFVEVFFLFCWHLIVSLLSQWLLSWNWKTAYLFTYLCLIQIECLIQEHELPKQSWSLLIAVTFVKKFITSRNSWALSCLYLGR